MGVAKTWIFPILRILILLAIAVALVKVAFFPTAAQGDDDVTVPTGELAEPVVAVARGTVVNDVVVDASVAADAPSAARATLAGEVSEVYVEPGEAVEAGQSLVGLRRETPRDPVVQPDGTVVEKQPLVETAVVTAPVAGTVAELPVIRDQAVAVGDAVAQVAPGSFHVTASLGAAQLYRLVSRPTEGTVAIAGGPAPFACTGLVIGTGASGAPSADAGASSSDGSDGSTGGEQQVTCSVPGDVTVFAGLAAELTVPAGVATDVLTVPLTAVEGAAGKGIVRTVTPEGEQEEREIGLGVSDGTTVEVTSGLEEGEEVLEFVPGAPAVELGCGPDGLEACG
ncbi:HlyD family efflux transporter periplasmic adaptor subunit [Frigoribacterium salinisoli]